MAVLQSSFILGATFNISRSNQYLKSHTFKMHVESLLHITTKIIFDHDSYNRGFECSVERFLSASPGHFFPPLIQCFKSSRNPSPPV